MKEPEIDAVQMLKQGFQKKQGKVMSEQQVEDAEMICDWVFASIKEDVLANMFFPRVNVAMLRSKEVEEPKNHSYSSNESDESKSCEESATIEEDTIDKSVLQDDLFLHTDSKDVMNYVKEIMDIVRQQRMPEFLKNLGMPICKNELAFLRDLQGLDYEVDHRPEFDVISIINTNVYLTKERTMKSFKEKEYEEKVKAAKEANIPEDRIMDRRLLDLLLNFEHIHNKAVFDAINESLDNYRPYGLKGLPFSWSKTTRTLTFKNNNTNEVENVLNKVTGEVNQWCKTLAGPLPESELMRTHGYVCNNSMQKSQLDEDRLVLMLALEIEQNEDRWIDYENEMTATKIDVSNMIYDVLMEETVHLLNALDVK